MWSRLSSQITPTASRWAWYAGEGDTMKETIKLYRLKSGWVARSNDPTIKELFGTDTIPTPYLYAADSETVLAEITKLNPNCQVTLASNNA